MNWEKLKVKYPYTHKELLKHIVEHNFVENLNSVTFLRQFLKKKGYSTPLLYIYALKRCEKKLRQLDKPILRFLPLKIKAEDLITDVKDLVPNETYRIRVSGSNFRTTEAKYQGILQKDTYRRSETHTFSNKKGSWIIFKDDLSLKVFKKKDQ